MSSLIVSAAGGGKDFAIHPAVPTAARCTRIIDLGTVDTTWEGKAKKSHKIVFCFESAVLMDDDQGEFAGKPFLIIQRYTASLSDKAQMRKDLESWRGRKFTQPELDGFELKNVLGKPCFLNMVHSDPKGGKTYSNISSIMPLPAGMTAPAAVGDLVFFSLSDFQQSEYDKLSDYFKKAIAESDEYKALFGGKSAAQKAAETGGKKPAAIQDDDIPF